MADSLQGNPSVKPGSKSVQDAPPRVRVPEQQIEIPEKKPVTKEDLPEVQAELDAWTRRARAELAAKPDSPRSKKDDIHFLRCSSCYSPAIFFTKRFGPGKLPPLEFWYAAYKPKGKSYFDGKPRCQVCGAGLRMVERNLLSMSKDRYQAMVKEPSDG